jgi:CheY-like chemotaxis protein
VPSPLKVLVVEDNQLMRDFIRSLVEEISSDVHECTDGASAVDLYERIRPDVVLMDVRMAGMDGLTATRAIRQSDPAARVVIVTANTDDQSRADAVAAGAAAFVPKRDLLSLPSLLAQQGSA